MAKALLINIKSGSFKEGASTISQQLIKNTFLSSKKSIDRKLKEIALTKKLEKQFSKDEILEIYLNTIYFGNNIYGIENASAAYFNKPSSELTLNESACLAGIVKSPNYYTSIKNQDALLKRKNLVLSEMLKDGKITQQEFDDNASITPSLNLEQSLGGNTTYQNAVINEACNMLGVDEKEFLSSGYIVSTFLDMDTQSALSSALQNETISNNFGGVVLDNETGGVVAMYSNLNSFSSLRRQAGSTVKPLIVYAPAIEFGKYYPDSFVLDEKIDIDGYSPKNASGNYLGYVTINKAVEKSLNTVAVKIFNQIGTDKCKQFGENLGLEFSPDDNSLPLALGASKNGDTLLNIASAYCTLADGGVAKQAKFIKEIRDKNGIILYSCSNNKSQVLSSETSYLMTKMLKNVAKSGTAKTLSTLPFEVASKTGTVGSNLSSKNSDAYNISYTTKHTFGVWVGSDNYEEESLMPKEINGSTLPTKIMKNVLEKVYSESAPANFKTPAGIKTINIDAQEYEQNHKIYLADENAPDRFIKQIEVPSSAVFEKSPNVFASEEQMLTNNSKIDIFSREYIFTFLKK